jgi:hypothetical protein
LFLFEKLKKLFIKIGGKGLLSILRLIKSKSANIKSGKIGLYYKGGFDKNMTRSEAYLILGLSRYASASEIKARHKSLMILNHPDRGKIILNNLKGGSTYISTKINMAKDKIIHDAPDK